VRLPRCVHRCPRLYQKVVHRTGALQNHGNAKYGTIFLELGGMHAHLQSQLPNFSKGNTTNSLRQLGPHISLVIPIRTINSLFGKMHITKLPSVQNMTLTLWRLVCLLQASCRFANAVTRPLSMQVPTNEQLAARQWADG
jgi:hypothetical protein